MSRKPGYSIEHDSWFIPLTQGVIALVDADMVPLLSQNNWYASRQGRSWYAARNGTVQEGNKSLIHMHRAVMCPPDSMDIDHRNHYSLYLRFIDNRRTNLRICTRSENAKNQRPNRGGSSPYKGVCWNTFAGKWTAQINIDGKQTRLGSFTDEIKAAHAYDAAADKHHGDFAWLNFPDDMLSPSVDTTEGS